MPREVRDALRVPRMDEKQLLSFSRKALGFSFLGWGQGFGGVRVDFWLGDGDRG